MKILWLFGNHIHYWGVPHERTTDQRMIQTCYECAKDREIQIELRPYQVRTNSIQEDRRLTVTSLASPTISGAVATSLH